MAQLAAEFGESATYKVRYIQCRHACTVVLTSNLGLTETKVTYFMLKGNRGEASHPGAYLAVKKKLVDNLLANLRSRFPQVELLNAMKVRLLQYCYSSS